MPRRKPIKGYVYIRKANRGVDTGPSEEDPIDGPEEGLAEVGHDPTGVEAAALTCNEGFVATGRRRSAPGGGDHGNDPTGGEAAALTCNEGFVATGRRRSAPGGGDHGNDPTGGGDHTGFLMFPKSGATSSAGAGLAHGAGLLSGLAWQVPLLIVGLLVSSQMLGFVDVFEYVGEVSDPLTGEEETETPSESFDEMDWDDDGVMASVDDCPDTELGLLVDNFGCPHFTEALVNNAFRLHDFIKLEEAVMMFGSQYSGQTELYRWNGDEIVELRSDVDFGSYAFFVGETENVAFFTVQGNGLWRTDGSWNGTYEVEMFDENGNQGPLQVECPCGTHGERVYFFSGGTMNSIDANENLTIHNNMGSQPRNMEPYESGFLMTFYTDQSIAYELYTIPFNGTNATLVKDIRPGQAYGMYVTGDNRASGFVHPQVIGDYGFFHTVSDGQLQFWRTNGAENGTFIFATANGSAPIGELRMGSNGDYWKYFHALPDETFPNQENGTFLYQESGNLWRSDGTVDGEILVEENLGFMSGFSDCGEGVLFLSSQGLHITLGDQGTTTLLPVNTPTLSPRTYAQVWSMCLGDIVLFTDMNGVPHLFDLSDLSPAV